jgi:hypothetical protein
MDTSLPAGRKSSTYGGWRPERALFLVRKLDTPEIVGGVQDFQPQFPDSRFFRRAYADHAKLLRIFRDRVQNLHARAHSRFERRTNQRPGSAHGDRLRRRIERLPVNAITEDFHWDSDEDAT